MIRKKKRTPAKARLFALFDKGITPKDIDRFPGIKLQTLYAYHSIWKKRKVKRGTPNAKTRLVLVLDALESMLHRPKQSG